MNSTNINNENLEQLLEKANAYYDGAYGQDCRGEAFNLYAHIVSIDPNGAFAINRLANCYNNGIGVDVDEEYAMALYRKGAELGLAAAQYNLADSLKKRGDPECIDWYIKAYQNGDSDAPYYLARIYLAGEIVPRNNSLGIEYYEKGISMGDRDSMLGLAVCLLKGEVVPQDKYRAAELMRQSAELGNATAASNMVKLYRDGEGVEANIQTALEWAFKAAELGDADELIDIGSDIFNGNAPYTMDKAKALEYFIFAGNCGSRLGMDNTGVCYNNGYGTPVNKEEAIAWFEKSARLGSEKAFDNLEKLYEEVYGDTSGERYIALLQEVAKDGYYMAMIKLHECYLEGNYVAKDVDQAMSYLEKAVDDEFATACFVKAGYLIDGEHGLPMDKQEAVRLWTIAAEKGHTSSAFNLGLCYRDGEGTEQNVDTSVYWLEKAAADESEKAILNLVDMYLEGKFGAKVDYDKGQEWLEKAVDLGIADAFFTLGLHYFQGEYGCIQSVDTALDYWKRGSNAGHSGCTKNIGLCYKNGEGVPQNFSEAISWFEKAVQQGSIDAMIELGLAYDDNGLTTPDYAKAVSYYAEAYSAGSAHGAYCLGTMYESGHGVAEDMAKAFELYKYAAENGHARGMAKTGMFYHDGLGTEKNVVKAVECFEAAKAMGDPDADNLLAFVYRKATPTEDGTDPMKAFEFNMKRAQEGDPNAQYQVYLAYDSGEGVEANQTLAQEWLKKAADNGHNIAQALMGFFCMVEDNAPMAVDYWEKASAGGHLKAMHDLAELYLDGADGVPVNKERAIKLLKEAAEKGFEEAQGTLGICYATGNGVPQNDREAFALFEQAAAKGNVYAQKNLGVCFRNGDGCAVDKCRAAEWFEKAAAQGNTQAQICLADMLADGEGIPTDYRKAEGLYRRVLDSRKQEYYDGALFGLALLYATKTKDHHKALPLWKELAEHGNGTAMYNLGLCYHNGWGTAKDDDQAILWWRMAADRGHADAQHNIDVVRQERANAKYHENSSGGCYVATAVYGSYDCPQVWTLRRFRDLSLAKTRCGRLFIKGYYAVSPTVVKWFGHTKWFNKIWRSILDRMVKKLNANGYENTPYSD